MKSKNGKIYLNMLKTVIKVLLKISISDLVSVFSIQIVVKRYENNLTTVVNILIKK